MTVRATRRSRWKAPLALTVLALGLAACAQNAPQDSLDPAGPIAEQIDNLFMPVFWIAAAIFVLVEGALVYALIRFRHRPGKNESPPQTHGNQRLEIGWTIAPALLLLGVAIPTVATIWSLAAESDQKPLKITVTGHQWWWQYDYDDLGVTTANEMHIPVDKEVELTLKSNDVIHSFWVPRLAGKQDLVPGRDNFLKLEAAEPGVYQGQCAEFCALSHANMRLRVIAQEQADFDRWVSEQKADALAVQDAGARAGQQEFLSNVCIQCHTVRGTEASFGKIGPDLTHFASRETFGGAIYDTNRQNLIEWLRDPQAAKPGNKMVIPKLSEEQIEALVAYLLTLK